MSMTNAAETEFWNLLFANNNWANIGDGTGLVKSTGDGVFWISLHTATPDETGTQTTSECAYTGYARKSVARNTGWTVSANNVSNTAAITFDPCTGGTETATYVGIGTDETGAGNLLFYALVSSPGAGLDISSGITPEIAIGALDVNID